MISKTRYVTPLYRGQGRGRRRKRNRRLFFIILIILLVLYLAFVIFSRNNGAEKKKVTPVASPKSFTAVQMENGKYRLKWSYVKGAGGYTVYKYNSKNKKFDSFKKFNKTENTFVVNDVKSKYAVKSYVKSSDSYVYSKKFTECKVTSISDMIEIVGHRGAMDQAPENTLVSYKRAYEIGYKGFETDYFETDSGDLIISHDKNISIFTDFDENILNVTDENTIDYPITKGVNVDKYPTQYMPTFEDAVKSAAKYNMNIYLHTKNRTLTSAGIEKIVYIIKKYNMNNKATVFTPIRELFLKLKKYDLRVGFLILPNNASEIKDAIDFAGKNKADVLIMHYTEFLRKKHILRAHKYNLKIGCYDTSDLSAAFKMVDFKLDFMITNRDFIS